MSQRSNTIVSGTATPASNSPASGYDNLPIEQTRNEPSPQGGGYERMARRRYQKPAPTRRGNQWTILVREDVSEQGQRTRKLKRVSLAPATVNKREAERLRDEYLEGVNQAHVGIGGACLFRDFTQIYERDVLSGLASTTRVRSQGVLKNHLIPAFGPLMLREITLEKAQAYFAEVQASKFSPESVDKIRDVLSAVLRTAVDFGRLSNNPAEKIRLRRRKLTRQKPFVRVEQFYALLALIPEPYASMVYVAVFTGLRVSELAGLLWRNVHVDSITIEQRYCRGDLDRPKSDSSRSTISVGEHVIERIHQLKNMEVVVKAGTGCRRYRVVKSDGRDDLVFQSVAKGTPMRDNNILSRHIKPAGRKLGMGWVNWQALRRSFATWLQMAGVDVKDAQGLMRHSRASTTQDIYQQVVPESQRKAVRKLAALVQVCVVQ